MTSLEELACTYSALILADDDIPITAEKLNTLLMAANLTVESIWPTLFARALGGISIRELVTNVGSLSMAASSAPAETGESTETDQGVGGVEKQIIKEEPRKEEEEEDEDEDMGFSLFN